MFGTARSSSRSLQRLVLEGNAGLEELMSRKNRRKERATGEGEAGPSNPTDGGRRHNIVLPQAGGMKT